MKTSNHAKEIASGKRFQFGRNWTSFLETIDQERIREAELSLQKMLGFLGTEWLCDKCFLDVGSGSGLFSLAARRLGARVRSFDYDPQSVACTRELKRRYFPEDSSWQIEEGSILDPGYLQTLGTFDVVYAWGVLHHTGSMWQALDNTCRLVSDGGTLFTAIYNDQGRRSDVWRSVKRLYCSGRIGKTAVCSVFFPFFAMAGLSGDLLRGKNPLKRYSQYKKSRGMSLVHDWFDWLGGYPFEVARPEQVIDFCFERGFSLRKLSTAGGHLGNNQFVFEKKVTG